MGACAAVRRLVSGRLGDSVDYVSLSSDTIGASGRQGWQLAEQQAVPVLEQVVRFELPSRFVRDEAESESHI